MFILFVCVCLYLMNVGEADYDEESGSFSDEAVCEGMIVTGELKNGMKNNENIIGYDEEDEEEEDIDIESYLNSYVDDVNNNRNDENLNEKVSNTPKTNRKRKFAQVDEAQPKRRRINKKF